MAFFESKCNAKHLLFDGKVVILGISEGSALAGLWLLLTGDRLPDVSHCFHNELTVPS